jgi:hypothetical protein
MQADVRPKSGLAESGHRRGEEGGGLLQKRQALLALTHLLEVGAICLAPIVLMQRLSCR